MNSLRARISALLIGAIAVVVVLATSVTIYVIDPPMQADFVELQVRQTRAIVPLLNDLPETQAGGEGGLVRRDLTLVGDVDERSTALLRDGLARAGVSLPIAIVRRADQFSEVMSIPLSGGRSFELPVAPSSPPVSPWLALGGWMALVLGGSAVVAVLAANRFIRPLAMLQETVSAVGRDGVLPRIEEDGPAEVRATAATLNLLSSRLRHAMESRMRLVAAAGHDFRTPLTRMRLRAEFMSDGQERESWLRDIEELDRIADSAILLVREEVADARGEPVALDELLADLVADLSALGHAITARALAPVAIAAGPLALRRALRNLLINAATHGRSARVTLSRDGDSALILIEDQGPGIPEELLGRVFEPFFRVDFARQHALPGAGLGLAIAKEIVDRHGGTIVIDNRPGGGLAQRLAFPAADIERI